MDVGKERIFGKIGIASYCLGHLFSFGGLCRAHPHRTEDLERGAVGAGLGTAGAVVLGGPLIVGATVGAGAGALGGYVMDELRQF